MLGQSARPLLLGLACVSAAACVKVGRQQVDPWRVFSLSPLPVSDQVRSPTSTGLLEGAIGVGPIRLPAYLDQDQIVTRISQNRFTLSDNDRWAESLEENIAHVLAQNLSALLPTSEITLHPWPAQQKPTYQLEIEVLKFETDTTGTAHLVARHFLRDLARRQRIAEKEVRLTATAAGSSTERSVASLSKALGEFSVGIANAVRGLSTPTVRNQPLKREGHHQPGGLSSRPDL